MSKFLYRRQILQQLSKYKFDWFFFLFSSAMASSITTFMKHVGVSPKVNLKWHSRFLGLSVHLKQCFSGIPYSFINKATFLLRY